MLSEPIKKVTNAQQNIWRHLQMLFEELGNGGVAGDAVGVLEHIMALILKD
jgi:hypothetical protein